MRKLSTLLTAALLLVGGAEASADGNLPGIGPKDEARAAANAARLPPYPKLVEYAEFGYVYSDIKWSDKFQVVGRLYQDGTRTILHIPRMVPRAGGSYWQLDLSKLPITVAQRLREECERDLPCVGHYNLTVTDFYNGIRANGKATLDAFR